MEGVERIAGRNSALDDTSLCLVEEKCLPLHRHCAALALTQQAVSGGSDGFFVPNIQGIRHRAVRVKGVNAPGFPGILLVIGQGQSVGYRREPGPVTVMDIVPTGFNKGREAVRPVLKGHGPGMGIGRRGAAAAQRIAQQHELRRGFGRRAGDAADRNAADLVGQIMAIGDA